MTFFHEHGYKSFVHRMDIRLIKIFDDRGKTKIFFSENAYRWRQDKEKIKHFCNFTMSQKDLHLPNVPFSLSKCFLSWQTEKKDSNNHQVEARCSAASK